MGVPRQFGVGTLLVITAMYALLFGLLRAFSCPTFGFVLVASFVTAVGLGQMLLFKGKEPRDASLLVGACFFGVMYGVVFPLLSFLPSAGALNSPGIPIKFSGWPVGIISRSIEGAVWGLVVGWIISRVFWIIDRLKGIWAKRSDRE